MAVRKLRESLSKLEICDKLVAYGFGNEEEGYLDYFLPDNAQYVASVNLDDMGAFIDDYDNGEHIALPFANGADRKILRTEQDVDEFLDFIDELNYRGNFTESTKRNKNNKRSIKEELDSDSYEDLKYEIYRTTERVFNSFVRNNETNLSDDEITSIMKEVTAQLLYSVVEV